MDKEFKAMLFTIAFHAKLQAEASRTSPVDGPVRDHHELARQAADAAEAAAKVFAERFGDLK